MASRVETFNDSHSRSVIQRVTTFAAAVKEKWVSLLLHCIQKISCKERKETGGVSAHMYTLAIADFVLHSLCHYHLHLLWFIIIIPVALLLDTLDPY